jgi:eukaryotic-like serine/threonine-protein kinase
MTGTIPDGLVGHDVQDVEAALDDLEFTNVQKSKAKSEDPNTQPGEVISIFPEEGSTVPLDSKSTIRYATE